jgi:hypothetical protein
MPNDGKLGLVLGVGLVIAVAVMFFHKEAATAHSAITENRVPMAKPADPSAAAPSAPSASAAVPIPSVPQDGPAPVKTAIRTSQDAPSGSLNQSP